MSLEPLTVEQASTLKKGTPIWVQKGTGRRWMRAEVIAAPWLVGRWVLIPYSFIRMDPRGIECLHFNEHVAQIGVDQVALRNR